MLPTDPRKFLLHQYKSLSYSSLRLSATEIAYGMSSKVSCYMVCNVIILCGIMWVINPFVINPFVVITTTSLSENLHHVKFQVYAV